MKNNSRTTIITGGAGRIGFSLAKQLINKKENVLIGDNNKKKLNDIKKRLNTKYLEVFNGDLTHVKNIDKFIKLGVKKFGKIDSAVHCLYPHSKGWGTKFENLKEKYLNEDLQKQLGGTIFFSQRILNFFLKQKKGNLILVSSIQGIQPPKFEHYSNLKMSSPIEYSAIKSGVISITKYLSKYYKKKNIRVNCISPGGIEDNQPKLFKKRYKISCNSKGLLNPRDISDAINFLLSEKSKYINGQNLIIDDGWSL
tara:strand:- start:422 stop:1183 length:762 start_codon:yes stop_codon:yes gene_type:complete